MFPPRSARAASRSFTSSARLLPGHASETGSWLWDLEFGFRIGFRDGFLDLGCRVRVGDWVLGVRV